MFLNSITLGTNTFDKQSVRPLSATYADNNQALNNPRILSISHEVGKSGQVSSAVILDDSLAIPIGNTMVTDKVRALFKIQYNPMMGRAELAAAIKTAVADLISFVGADANLAKILNKES